MKQSLPYRGQSLSVRLFAMFGLAFSVLMLIGCVSQNTGAVIEASNDIRTSVAVGGGLTPTPITEGQPVDESVVSPIRATFFPERQTTEYVVELSPPGDGGEWSKPSCGEYFSDQDGYRLVWTHAHPPCDETTDHADEEITFNVRVATFDGAEDVVCEYSGSLSGIGEQCVWTFVGVDRP